MQMQVGEFRFEAGPGRVEYSSLDHDASRRWRPVERLGRPPAWQDLGADAARLRIRGQVAVRTRADLDALDALRDQARLDDRVGDDAEPLEMPVFWGGSERASGRFGGWWVVTGCQTRHRDLRLAEGYPTRIEFSIEMRSAAPHG